MNCEAWQDKIDGFVDSELARDEALGFGEHLRTCPGCSQETLARQRLKAETRLAGQQFAPSPEFERRMRGRIAPKRARLMWWPAVAGAAGGLVGVAVLGLRWGGAGGEERGGAPRGGPQCATLGRRNSG